MNAPDIRHFMFFPNSHWIAEFCHSGRILQMRKAIKKIKVMTSKGFITKRPDNYAVCAAMKSVQEMDVH